MGERTADIPTVLQDLNAEKFGFSHLITGKKRLDGLSMLFLEKKEMYIQLF